MRYLVSILFSVICLSQSISCDNSKNSSEPLPEVTIRNQLLFEIVDSLLTIDQSKDYYETDLVYNIHIQVHEQDTLVQLGSVGRRKVKTGDELGCFNYKSHLFIVSGNCLIDSLFEKTSSIINVNFYERSSDNLRDFPDVIDVYENDEFLYWDFHFSKGLFYPIKY